MPLVTPDIGEQVLDLGKPGGRNRRQTFAVERAADPNISPAYALPTDFVGQYPQVAPTSEIVAMCEEIGMLNYLPQHSTGLKTEIWREMNQLSFISGSQYIAFGDGLCPEEYYHDGDNTYVTLKNIGAKKTLGISDIMDSAAKAAGGLGINRLVGPSPSSFGLPGGYDGVSFQQAVVMDLKEKEMRTGLTLVMNGWDALLINGNATTFPFEFDGIETYLSTGTVCGGAAHWNTAADASGTFSAASFDRFLSEACAKPTVLMGHPTAIQEMMSAYFQLGFQGSQIINVSDGNRLIPGFNFGGFVNTGIGRLPVVADSNFARVDFTGSFSAVIYGLRMTHNGEPLVYVINQIPLSFNDLTPGCTTIAFQLWAKTALVIKHCCAQSAYRKRFTGNIVTTCPVIGATIGVASR